MRFPKFQHLLLGIVSACGEATAPPATTFDISPATLELAEGRIGTLTLLTSLPDYRLTGLTYWSYVPDQPSGGGVAFSEGFLLPWPQEVMVHAWGATTGRVIVEHVSALLADTIPLRVYGVSVAAVTVEPSSAAIRVGEWSDLYPQVLDSVGAGLQRYITWSSSDSSVATIEYWASSGFSTGFTRVSGLKAGTTTVSATAEGVTTEIAIVVTAP